MILTGQKSHEPFPSEMRRQGDLGRTGLRLELSVCPRSLGSHSGVLGPHLERYPLVPHSLDWFLFFFSKKNDGLN